MCKASPQHQAQKKMCTCFSSTTRDMKPGRNIPVMACSTQKTDMPGSLSCILLASENVCPHVCRSASSTTSGSTNVCSPTIHKLPHCNPKRLGPRQVAPEKRKRGMPPDFGCATKREGQPQRSPAASKIVLNNLRALTFFTQMCFSGRSSVRVTSNNSNDHVF